MNLRLSKSKSWILLDRVKPILLSYVSPKRIIWMSRISWSWKRDMGLSGVRKGTLGFFCCIFSAPCLVLYNIWLVCSVLPILHFPTTTTQWEKNYIFCSQTDEKNHLFVSQCKRGWSWERFNEVGLRLAQRIDIQNVIFVG